MSDNVLFKCEDDEFCLMLSHPTDWSHVIDEKHDTKSDNSNSRMFVKTMGYKRCELIACGYLRKNWVNPKDISTIIAKYFTQNNKISLNICKNHYNRMILFPNMKNVCITFSKMFNFSQDNGCNRCSKIRFRCGIIGIRQIDKEKNEHNELNNDNDNENASMNIETFYKLFSEYNDEIVTNESDFNFKKMKDGLKAINSSIKNKEMNKNKKLIDDMEIIDCPFARAGGNLGHRIVYNGGGHANYTWNGITRTSIKRLSNNMFGFNDGDFIVLEYDKDNNSFSIEAHCNKNKNKNKNKNDKEKTGNVSNCVTLTDNIIKGKNLAITGKDNKLILKNGYDYVLACCICGCDKRSPGMNNVYTFSGKRQNCL